MPCLAGLSCALEEGLRCRFLSCDFKTCNSFKLRLQARQGSPTSDSIPPTGDQASPASGRVPPTGVSSWTDCERKKLSFPETSLSVFRSRCSLLSRVQETTFCVWPIRTKGVVGSGVPVGNTGSVPGTSLPGRAYRERDGRAK